jgi:hypothetical protein
MKPRPETLDHVNAQLSLAGKHLANAAWCPKKRYQISAGQIVLVEQIGQNISEFGGFLRPLTALVSFDQACLSGNFKLSAGLSECISLSTTAFAWA